MKNKLVTGSLAVMALILPLAVGAGEKGPSEIDLKARFHVEGKKAAVIFPHAEHQEHLECTNCHAVPEGGELKVEIVNLTGPANDFHKKFCWPCHEEKNVPKGKSCNTCHKDK